jgi:virginiamycin A acetyltransferase
MSFINSYYNYILERVKTHVKLHIVYPQNEKFKRIKSVIPKTVSIGEDVRIMPKIRILNHLQHIGDHVFIGRDTYVGFCKSIGSYTCISFDVKLGIDSHPFYFVSSSPYFYAKYRGFVEEDLSNPLDRGLTEVGCDVLIGTQAMILSGVKLGHGCIIGAGSVVNKNVPPYAIVRGIPGKVVAYRFDEETIQKLLKSKWWEFSKEQLIKYKPYMNQVEKFIEQLEHDNII